MERKLNNGIKCTRWQTPEGLRLGAEVFERLLAGASLLDLRLGEHRGRLDLRGLCAPEVSIKDLPRFRNWSVQKLAGQVTCKNVRFDGIDFGGAQLKHLLFFDSTIDNCSFERADCEHWRLFGTNLKNCTFVRANLRDAVLGPWYEGRGNTHEHIDFSQANMLGLISTTATYINCDFSDAKLEKIDFESSGFIRCRFAGELREVVFWDHGFKTGKPDPNPMEDVDFSQAKLRWVEFRRLNLDHVRFPEDEDHLVIKNYRCVLRKALAALKDNENNHARRLRAILEIKLRWIGPQQEIGVMCRLDFRERWGETGEEFAVELLRRMEQECSRTSVS